ncbi:efflux RND transporter periplasmic adaptor subunit [Maridesulfovibrio hydrothermalis]|uniref:Efflux transporter, RND family, MFP subunit n=1 Tax=Maridesulfovibrio hydrothermalis AM13 = DSM 14728 TaxID=1121451 RepID=L0RBQ3_9BACT|nr:efflux RND transporter periplasmic adaptor subunit [Maridesulfovibrio hydrothermalis]CCO23652.1 Efflux transporter, RND family, MFP subunit [Maridesulfovibrio hydrothermalis AM13 = DSM 14728]
MSNIKNIKSALVPIIIVAVIAFGAGYWISGPAEDSAGKSIVDEHAEHGLDAEITDTGEVVWTCSMHPQIQLPEPGKCPLCFMDLIPLEKGGESGDEAISLRQISLTDRSRKLAGIASSPVERRNVSVETRMVGKVDYDETRIGTITAWTGGRIDKLYIDYTGSSVRRGQAMASIYSPELLTAQVELIQAVKAKEALQGSSMKVVKDTAARTAKAAREKLRLLGLSKTQIANIIKKGKAAQHITLYSPMSGIVIKKDVVEGVYVKTGTPIYTIADLSRVWVILEAYESDLPWIRMGMLVDFTTEAYPGKSFQGKVVYIDPVVNEKTRTIRIRLEVPNKGLKLKPGMFVRAVSQIDKKAETQLVIPASAPLITGKRAVVYIAVPGKEGVYEGREIVLGPKAGDFYVVKYGLAQGERVVTKGNFKIDSALQIIAKPSMMNQESGVKKAVHNHGGDSAVMENMDNKIQPEYTLPPLFISRLVYLKKDFDKLMETAKSGNIDESRKLYSKFFDSVTAIDSSGLKGESSLVWKELSMLLANDTVLGSGVKDARRLKSVTEETAKHFMRLDMAFDISNIAKHAGSTVAAPEVFKAQLGKVYTSYSAFTEALAADNMQLAQKQAALMTEELKKVDHGSLSEEAHMVWMGALKNINDGISAIREAKDIVGIRAGLEPLSYGMIDAVEKLGIKSTQPVYEVFCPMAFDFKGAKWLQSDENIRNPYFGEAMLQCGEVERQIKGKE